MKLISKNNFCPYLFQFFRLNWLAILLIWPSVIFAQPWELVRDEQQVQVFKQSISGQLDRFLVQTKVEASTVAILSLLQDLGSNTNWVENSLGVELIKQLSVNENIIRTRLQAPWPFKNRDIVNYSHYWQDRHNCGLFIDIQAMPNAIEPDDDYQRVTNFQAKWSSYPLSEKNTLIRYSGWLDPGGYIPELVSSHVAIYSLFTTFVNMRQELVKAQYQKITWGLSDTTPCTPAHYYKNTLGK